VRVLVAGASGAVGVPLTRQLIAAGHEVIGLSRNLANLDRLRALGGEAVVADALDWDALLRALDGLEADAVIHREEVNVGRDRLQAGCKRLAGVSDTRHQETPTREADLVLDSASRSGTKKTEKSGKRTVYAAWPERGVKHPAVISVELDEDEEVEWTWTHTADGRSVVTGYTSSREPISRDDGGRCWMLGRWRARSVRCGLGGVTETT